MGGEIIHVTFWKFVTLLVQKLLCYKNCATLGTDSGYWIFFFSCWTNDVTNFLNVIWIISPLTCHFRFLIVVLKAFKFEWQCSQYLILNPTCDNPKYIHLICCGFSTTSSILIIFVSATWPVGDPFQFHVTNWHIKGYKNHHGCSISLFKTLTTIFIRKECQNVSNITKYSYTVKTLTFVLQIYFLDRYTFQ